MPSPAPVPTHTSWPWTWSSLTLSGVSPTRYSWFLISRTVPTRMDGLLCAQSSDPPRSGNARRGTRGSPAGCAARCGAARRRRDPRERISMKQLVAFDLDGTLAESKQPLKEDMADAIADLLGVANVAVISGGDWPQFD